MTEPKTVVVYRSKGEQMRDEYLWGQGFFSPMGVTDILIIVTVAAVGFISWAKISNWFTQRNRRKRRGY